MTNDHWALYLVVSLYVIRSVKMSVLCAVLIRVAYNLHLNHLIFSLFLRRQRPLELLLGGCDDNARC